MAADDARSDDQPTAYPAPMFISTKAFDRRWEAAGLTGADLTRLYVLLRDNPTAGPVMGSTGGLRKVRFAPAGKGKSGAVRVCYAVFTVADGVILLFTVFTKSTQGNLTDEQMNDAAAFLTTFERDLKEYVADPHKTRIIE